MIKLNFIFSNLAFFHVGLGLKVHFNNQIVFLFKIWLRKKLIQPYRLLNNETYCCYLGQCCSTLQLPQIRSGLPVVRAVTRLSLEREV